MLKPLNDRAVVKPDAVEDKTTASGFIISTTEQEKALAGIVIVGNSVVEEGDHIVFSMYGYDEFQIDMVKYYAVSAPSIIGIL